MLTVHFYGNPMRDDETLRYAVIAARYEGKWVFCRHKERSTWEIPGGHREPGEKILDTAKRELYEETGATEADIRPVEVYGVERGGVVTYGMLCFAEIRKLDQLPEESEIGEIILEEKLPKELTYPAIQPHLHERVQAWLNLQSNAGELWDIYDENRVLTGRTHRRGEPLAAGDYHLVVDVWVRNANGEFLVTKRSSNKGFPNLWECSGGSALAGDNSLTAALRELREETGLQADPECGQLWKTERRERDFHDIWLFRQDFALEEVVLQEGETCDAAYVTAEELLQMWKDGRTVPLRYLEEFLAWVARNEK